MWCQKLGKTQSYTAAHQPHHRLRVSIIRSAQATNAPLHAHTCAYKDALNSPHQSQTHPTHRTRSMPCAYQVLEDASGWCSKLVLKNLPATEDILQHGFHEWNTVHAVLLTEYWKTCRLAFLCSQGKRRCIAALSQLHATNYNR